MAIKNTHGGKRKGAGRKNKTGRRAHTKRERVDFDKPLHITLKIRQGNLRRGYVFKHMKHVSRRLRKFAVYVIQFSLLNDHIHMIVEARNNGALTRAMKSLTGSLAKLFDVRFKDRFHLNKITTPRQMKNTYRYVLLNFAKHEKLAAHIDKYSTGQTFRHWPRIATLLFDAPVLALERYGLSEPRSWLATRGWMRA